MSSKKGGCDQATRGRAAEARERYELPREQRQATNAIVHCHNNDSNCSKAKNMNWSQVESNPTKPTFRDKK